MRKLFGTVLILCGGVWGRWKQLHSSRLRRNLLMGMLFALRQMAEEIRMARTPLTDLTAVLGRGGEAAVFFRSVSETLRRGVPVQLAWKTALPMLELPRRQEEILAELGEELRGDEEKMCKAISLCIHRLEKEFEELERTTSDRERRDTGLWLSGAALAVILML